MKTGLRVLLFHPVLLPVQRYGGTERVVYWLMKTLLKKGYQVGVFAAPGSKMPDGVACHTDPSELFSLAKQYDILHAFSKPSPELCEAFEDRVLVTIQGNGQLGEHFHRNTVFVSRNHAERHGATEFVYNGLDPDELKFDAGPRPNRYLFLSKTSWSVKNLSGAMRLCAKAQKNLWIAGGDRPYGSRIQVALKKLMGQDWRWVGTVDQREKSDFWVSGKAFVFPLLWNEPFGIVLTESLVSGTPVLAHPFGSVPEVLEFSPQCLMKSEEDWMRALKGDVDLPSAQDCRDWVLSRFHQDTMTERYLSLYERVLSGKTIHEKEPVTQVTAEDLSAYAVINGVINGVNVE